VEIVLPVGISFYTFQTMSYTIDIYRGQLEPTQNFWDFALFVSFFPQLVAGPIERARSLLPQILERRHFQPAQMMEGLRLVCWGLFKKSYVADNLAPLVDTLFATPNPSGLETLLAAYAFAFQIYCDFSGYSDIARGCAKCLGFEIMVNFNLPYIAAGMQEFWRRWHISLSTWLRDYLYIPLGGNRDSKGKTYRNLTITMLLGGLWHGAAWTFVLWGAYHGALLAVQRLWSDVAMKAGGASGAPHGAALKLVRVLATFHLVCLGWLIFRAASLPQLYGMLAGLAQWRPVSDGDQWWRLIQFVGPLLLFEWIEARSQRVASVVPETVWVCGRSAAFGVVFYMFVFHAAAAESFIYFAF